MVEVAPLVADLAPLPGELPAQPAAVARAELGPRLAPLQIGDPRPRFVEEPRVGNDLAIGGGQESGHANVNTSRAAGGNQRLGDLLGHHDHIPAAVLPLELQRLHPAVDGPMLVDLDAPDRLEGRARPPATVGRLPLGAIPGDEQHLVEPLVGLNGGWPGCGACSPRALARLAASTRLKNAAKVAFSRRQRLLLRGERMPPWPLGSSARISLSWADWPP